MHSSNIGQRNIKPSERAQGFRVLADKLVEWRKDDPSLKGVNTKTYLAEHFGVSERTAQVLLNIARNLSKEGNDLLDAGSITQSQAEALSKLSSVQQESVINAMHKEELTADEISTLIEAAKASKQEQPIEALVAATQTKAHEKVVRNPKAPKDVNGYLKTARNALRHAENAEGEADFKLLGKIKALVRSIEKSLD